MCLFRHSLCPRGANNPVGDGVHGDPGTREVLPDEASTLSESCVRIHRPAEDFFLIGKCNYLKSLTNAYIYIYIYLFKHLNMFPLVKIHLCNIRTLWQILREPGYGTWEGRGILATL